MPPLWRKAFGPTKNGRATLARSFNPTPGQRGGSTADPILAAAITEGRKHDIGKRTIQRARATVRGKSPTARTLPTLLPAPYSFESRAIHTVGRIEAESLCVPGRAPARTGPNVSSPHL